MGFDYIRRHHDCDACDTRLSSRGHIDYSVDNPENTDGYDEYCEACYTELGGRCWSGDWDAEGNRIAVEANHG
jgi:hypothetical protein